MEKKYGYARVSTKDQNLERQLIELRKYVEDERDIITDKESGKDFDRPGYQYLRERLLRPGDTLIVKSLDRLGRTKPGIVEELQHFKKMSIRVMILDLPTTMIELPGAESWVVHDDPEAAGRRHRSRESTGQTAGQAARRVSGRMGENL